MWIQRTYPIFCCDLSSLFNFLWSEFTHFILTLFISIIILQKKQKHGEVTLQRSIHEQTYYNNIIALGHRAGMYRGVLIGQFTQILDGSFRRGLNAQVVTFSARLVFSPCPLTRVSGKTKMAQKALILYSGKALCIK